MKSFRQSAHGNAAVEYGLLLLVITGAILVLSHMASSGLVAAFGNIAHAFDPMTIVINWP